jgi:DNA helicase-2/ATP-dependent DNA helicase PcrA
MVVGDDDQSIYSWRGADPSNIIEFNEHYPAAKIVRLEQNYRCAGNIVDAASAVIRNNKKRAEKTLWTENQKGSPIQFCLEHDGESEAWYIIDQIKAEKENFGYEDIAVFYRTNAQSRQFEDVLRRNMIPYQIFGSLRFYDRAEIKDLLGYIRLLVNPKDDAAFLRIVNVPARGIGKKAQDDLSAMAEQNKVSVFEMAKQVVENKVPRLSAKIAPFVKLIEDLKMEVNAASISETISILLDHVDYRSHLEKKFPEQVEDKMGNVHELGAALSSYAEEFPEHKLNRWLQDISLQGSEEQSEGGVTLMTLHSAKGLEFNRVYLVGFEDGLLPHTNSMDYEDDLEEERRLLYVGMTRAKIKLTLTGAKKRRVFNNWMANPPSRFLAEIPTDLLEIIGTAFSQNEMFASTGYDEVSSPEAYEAEYESEPTSYSVGMGVSHPTYGNGVIDSIDNEYGVIKAIVNFSDFGKRKVTASQLEASDGYSGDYDDEIEYSYD